MKTALIELFQSALITLSLIVPVALWYTGVLERFMGA